MILLDFRPSVPDPNDEMVSKHRTVNREQQRGNGHRGRTGEAMKTNIFLRSVVLAKQKTPNLSDTYPISDFEIALRRVNVVIRALRSTPAISILRDLRCPLTEGSLAGIEITMNFVRNTMVFDLLGAIIVGLFKFAFSQSSFLKKSAQSSISDVKKYLAAGYSHGSI